MGAKIVGLGRQVINFGQADDPERIAKMVTCKHWRPEMLQTDHFADQGEPARRGKGIANWPEGELEHELFAVCFNKDLQFIDGLDQAIQLLPPDYVDLKRATFPHLMTLTKPENLDWLVKNRIVKICLTNEDSLYRIDYLAGNVSVCLPFLRFPALYLGVNHLDNILWREVFFLFYRD